MLEKKGGACNDRGLVKELNRELYHTSFGEFFISLTRDMETESK